MNLDDNIFLSEDSSTENFSIKKMLSNKQKDQQLPKKKHLAKKIKQKKLSSESEYLPSKSPEIRPKTKRIKKRRRNQKQPPVQDGRI